MRLLYGRHFNGRFTPVAHFISSRSVVHEVCAGDCYFYRRFLAGRDIAYSASDINPAFTASGHRKGINIERRDIRADPVPRVDHVVMLASLYQFIPEHRAVIDRLLAGARASVIITEPVVNLASSANPLVRLLGRFGTNPGTGNTPRRFTERSLDEFFTGSYPAHIQHAEIIAGGREKMYVLTPAA
jgi:hypothetical protein